MINKQSAKAYCREDISLIENYENAINDKTQTWVCHHRRETVFSRKDLIEIGEYYKRPACELIFLTSLEHNRLHKLGKHHSEEVKKKMSEYHIGKHYPKLSEAKTGNHWYNNGVTSIQAKTCPEGFVPGRLK